VFRARLGARAGLKNGEKQLRALLVRTHEWDSADARQASALRADASGLPELADALRARDISGACALRPAALAWLAQRAEREERRCSRGRAATRNMRRTKPRTVCVDMRCLLRLRPQRCASATSSRCAATGATAATCGAASSPRSSAAEPAALQ
jgi:hypothetical protein